MELYSKVHEKYIDIADGQFSIEAQNQLQDLENYKVCNSFDLKIINNEMNCDIINQKEYEKEVTEWMEYPDWMHIEPHWITYMKKCTDYPILLMHNNQPLLQGRLVYQGGDADTLTVVYQAVPYCKAFENFVFREKLRDYFKPNFYMEDNIQIYKFLEFGASASSGDYLMGKNGNKCRFDILNNHSNNWDFRIPSLANNYRTAMDLGGKQMASTHDFQRYFAGVKIADFLKCLGIETPHIYNSELSFWFKMGFKITKKYKIRLFKTSWKKESGSSANRVEPYFNLYKINYKSNQQSPMGVWNDYRQDWDEGTDTEDWGNIIQWGDFSDSLRDGKTLEGMVIEDVLFNADYSIDVPQLRSIEMQQPQMFNVHRGQKFDEGGKDFTVSMYVSDTNNFGGIISQIDVAPQYIDIVFSLDVQKDFYTYPKKWGTFVSTDSSFARTPIQATDLEFLDMSTNDFLNYLSLNVRSYMWLRNPLFLSIDNAEEVWGNENGTSIYDWLDDSNIISMEKNVDMSVPSYLRITIPSLANNSVVKKLNNFGNEEKEIKVELPSVCYQNTWEDDPNTRRSYPPLWYDGTRGSEVEKRIFGDLLGVFGYFEERTLDLVSGKPHVWNFFDDTTDFDYFADYQDTSETYKVKCTGYQLHDRIYINKTKYVVLSYKTDDFVVFSLTLAKVKDD